MYIRRNRIKTETQIPAPEEPKEYLKRVKIKNFRFSFEQKNAPRPDAHHHPALAQNKRGLATNKTVMSRLPELGTQKEEIGWRGGGRLEGPSQQKKDRLLSQIVELHILKAPEENQQKGRLHDWKNDSTYVNEFFDERPQHNTTKHYRAPKILENELMKYNQHNNIVRRKIFSEDKRRREKTQDRQEEGLEGTREGDLQKIQIITFSNKFPGLRRGEEEK